MAYAAWNQSTWWSALEENGFGWLTPAFCALVLYDRRERIVASWRACGEPGSPRASGWRGTVAGAAIAAGFGIGIALFLAGALHRAGAGPSVKGTFVASLGVTAVLLSLPWLSAPRSPSPRPSGFSEDARTVLCGLLLFPSAIWLLSAPLVSMVDSRLSLLLLRPIMGFVAFAFDMLGLPIGREGNVLILPDHGRVGVEEACSGIRSLTTCVFAGSFLGAVYLEGWRRKLLLVGASVALALCLNLVRSLFLTGWAYGHGTQAIEGGVHDAAGYAVLAGTVAGLCGILAVLNGPARRSRSAGATP
jgi:exosortase/archaeosortase family protein